MQIGARLQIGFGVRGTVKGGLLDISQLDKAFRIKGKPYGGRQSGFDLKCRP